MTGYPPEDRSYDDNPPQPVRDDPYRDVPHTVDRTPPDAPQTPPGATLAGPRVLCVADVAAERVQWLWDGRIARGKLTVVDGDPGQGKSTLTTDLAARISTGTPLPGGTRTVPAAVVLLSAEDGVGDTIRPRLEAAGADTTRVFVFDSVLDGEGTPRPPSIPADIPYVEALVSRERAVLVVIDPLMAFLGSGVDAHRDQDVRRALHSLAAVAERTGAAIVIVRHLNKSGGPQAIYRGGGSIGIIGAARSGLLVASDPDDDTRRIVAVTKSNLAAMPEALAYRLINDDEHGCARVVWEGATSHTADSLLAVPRDEDERTERDAAADWLRDTLAGQGLPASEVLALGKKAGYSETTLKRAKKRVGVESRKKGMDGGWVWMLPDEQGHPSPEEAEEGHAPASDPLRTTSVEADPLRFDVEDDVLGDLAGVL